MSRPRYSFYGKTYRHYQQRVRMLLPLPKKYLVIPEENSFHG